MKTAFVAGALVAGGAFWFWHEANAPGPVPSDDLVVQLAEDEWGGKDCYSPLHAWPCVVTQDIRLDYTERDLEPRDSGEPFRRCFDVYLNVETTAFDYSIGGAANPRTYAEAPEPLGMCADVSYLFGSADETESWIFTPVSEDDDWSGPIVKELRDLLCASPPAYAAYDCPA